MGVIALCIQGLFGLYLTNSDQTLSDLYGGFTI